MIDIRGSMVAKFKQLCHLKILEKCGVHVFAGEAFVEDYQPSVGGSFPPPPGNMRFPVKATERTFCLFSL